MSCTRVILTGSQGWADRDAILRVLAAIHVLAPGAVLVTGGCERGADAIGTRIWRGFGSGVETHRPAWRPGGVYNPRAGFERSERMVLAGGDLCTAFILPCQRGSCSGRKPDRGLAYHGTHGSVHCADFAEDHGITVRRYEP